MWFAFLHLMFSSVNVNFGFEKISKNKTKNVVYTKFKVNLRKNPLLEKVKRRCSKSTKKCKWRKTFMRNTDFVKLKITWQGYVLELTIRQISPDAIFIGFEEKGYRVVMASRCSKFSFHLHALWFWILVKLGKKWSFHQHAVFVPRI